MTVVGAVVEEEIGGFADGPVSTRRSLSAKILYNNPETDIPSIAGVIFERTVMKH
jgi:hypothetical protein